jgi:hypothetical protein
MALSDVFAHFKEGLEERFNAKPHNPAAARKPVLKGIDLTREQFEENRTRGPGKWWSVSNGVVAFSPKLKGVPLMLNGRETNHVDAGDFPAFLAGFRSAVEAGDLDDAIRSASNGEAAASTMVRPKRASGISAEAAKLRGQKAAESRARNKAARETG